MKTALTIAVTLTLSAALAGTYYGNRSASVALETILLEPKTVQAKALLTSPPRLSVGSISLQSCGEQGAFCGSLKVPLDWIDADAPKITVGFEYYPSSNPKATKTAVAMEGGPGFASTDSRNEFLAMYEPLRSSHHVLLFDRRGTGRSSVIKCNRLQRGSRSAPRSELLEWVRACGKQLDSTYRYESGANKGSFVRASGLFGTTNAVKDLAAVIGALQLGPVDLYGDSYGTYFSQAFTSRFPKLLRSVTLDSSYPVIGQNPWYTTSFETIRDAFALVCARSLACAASGASGLRDLELLAKRLRNQPISGNFRDPRTGQMVSRTVNIQSLLALAGGAASSSLIYRELNAAGRALLERNDSLPLVRLVVEATPDQDSGPFESFSVGLYVAAICTDYPQLYSRTAPEAMRASELEAALRSYPTPEDFAPFTMTEALSSVMYACLAWPAALRDDPAITIDPPIAPANLPVMVLSGDLDSTTPPVLNREVTAQMGPSARLINMENTLHVVSYGNPSDCGNKLVQAFVRQPGKLATLDASCVQQIPEIRTVGAFAARSFDVAPATPRAGNRAGVAALKLAAVAASVAGDANFRFITYFAPGGVALRGGTWKASTENQVFIRLTNAKWTNDSSVSGIIDKDVGNGINRATLTIKTANGVSGTIKAIWVDGQRQALVTLTGVVAGQKLVAQMPAP